MENLRARLTPQHAHASVFVRGRLSIRSTLNVIPCSDGPPQFSCEPDTHRALVGIYALAHVWSFAHPRALVAPAIANHDARDAGAIPQDQAQPPLRRPLAELRVLEEGIQVVTRHIQRVAPAPAYVSLQALLPL